MRSVVAQQLRSFDSIISHAERSMMERVPVHQTSTADLNQSALRGPPNDCANLPCFGFTRETSPVSSGKADPLKILSAVEPMSDAIAAYKMFDSRKSGRIKVELNPRR